MSGYQINQSQLWHFIATWQKTLLLDNKERNKTVIQGICTVVNYESILTHLPLDKMAAISQTTFSDAFFLNETLCILINISVKFVPKGPINNIRH